MSQVAAVVRCNVRARGARQQQDDDEGLKKRSHHARARAPVFPGHPQIVRLG
jgi:hypothetical protein